MTEVAPPPVRTLRVLNGGFLFQRRLRRILQLSGWQPRPGLPRNGETVGVWGNSPTAHRGLRAAQRAGAPLLRVEDAFLRSMQPGRAGEPPLGLCLDAQGLHFDASGESALEALLARHPLDDTSLLDRARAAMARMQEQRLSKYSGYDPALPLPEPGYVLVIDQTVGDASVRASVRASGADRARFVEMLAYAQEENPGARVLIRAHPETAQGFRGGYFSDADCNERISLCDSALSPWDLLEGAVAVYTVSSQMGFEAILAGHKPRVFGSPFYAGWGLTQDDQPVARRQRVLTRAQLFAAAMILYPVWYDPFEDQLCSFERALDILEAQARAWRQDQHGWSAGGMRLWKRKALQQVFGRSKRMVFSERAKPGRPHMVWASKAKPEADVTRVEDGFLRSRGLGAALVPPLSLVTDQRGIYYDPGRASDLEDLITARARLRPDQRARAEVLIARIVKGGLSKYNLGGSLPLLPEGPLILVPGQVEDDASIRCGAGVVRHNRALLEAARAAHPEAVILYKPHPDVEAGLRPGAVAEMDQLADIVVQGGDPARLLEQVSAVWTMTSLLGFEALLRGVPVTTLGMPFYAGWGLTTDLAPERETVCARRQARPDLAGLVHATLIDYPRYFDPLTGQICPVEVAIDRLQAGDVARGGALNRGLSKLQGLFASYAPWWR